VVFYEYVTNGLDFFLIKDLITRLAYLSLQFQVLASVHEISTGKTCYFISFMVTIKYVTQSIKNACHT
jgi:hypothetical protein